MTKTYDLIRELPEPDGRRRVPRRKINKVVGVLFKGKYYLCQAYEIGEGGILIDFPIQLNVNDRVVVTVRIPGALHGVILSKVVYDTTNSMNSDAAAKMKSNASKYGLQFENIEFEIRRKMRNYVASSLLKG